jgi:putative nucleotidyltransferase with HDIG domain
MKLDAGTPSSVAAGERWRWTSASLPVPGNGLGQPGLPLPPHPSLDVFRPEQGAGLKTPATAGKVLVVDDELITLAGLVAALDAHGYVTRGFTTAQEALRALETEEFDLILCGLTLPQMGGLALLRAALQLDPNLVGIILAEEGTLQTAIEAIKIGAFDYVLKPFVSQTFLPLLERAMCVRRLRQENVQLREMVGIHELCAAIADTLDQTALLNKAADAAMQQMGADEVSIMLPTEAGDELYIAAVRPRHRESILGRRVPLDQGVAGWVAQHPEPLTLVGPVADPRFKAARPRADIGYAVAMPMMVAGKLIGIFNINFIQPRRTSFTSGQVKALSILASTAAAALESARQREAALRHHARTQALRTIDLAIMNSTDLRLSLQAIIDQALDHLQVDGAAIYRVTPLLQSLDFVAGRGIARQPRRENRGLAETVARRAALERRLVAVPDVTAPDETGAPASEPTADGFAAYFAAPLMVKGKVDGVLEVACRAPRAPDAEWLGFLETLAGQAAIAVDNATLFDSLQRSNVELASAYDATIEGWSRVLDLRDRETEGHTQRVTETTLQLARAMGLSDAELVIVRRGALLHDIGKMGVPDNILNKPGKLTDDEWNVMRQHPQLAFDMLAPIAFLRPALAIPGCHHEWWNGSGYPRGLRGEQIPLAARLFMVVDVWDALRSDRPYRQRWPDDRVFEHLRARAGTHFDPRAVDVFFKVVQNGRPATND